MELARRGRLLLVAGLAVAGLSAAGWALWRRDRGGEDAAALRQEDRVTVEVLNASGRRGLARVATRELRRAGLDVLSLGTAAESLAVTQVLARRGDSAAAVRVARALGVGVARVRTDTLLRVDVTVLLGGDYRPPAGIRP